MRFCDRVLSANRITLQLLCLVGSLPLLGSSPPVPAWQHFRRICLLFLARQRERERTRILLYQRDDGERMSSNNTLHRRPPSVFSFPSRTIQFNCNYSNSFYQKETRDNLRTSLVRSIWETSRQRNSENQTSDSDASVSYHRSIKRLHRPRRLRWYVSRCTTEIL